MARQVTEYRIFVASPSDVEDERNCLEEVILELNKTWPKSQGIRLDLVRWETDVMPGMGKDAQAIINDQIDDDYDLFIGILGVKFGTPTPRAGSGTEEEFNRAYKLFEDEDRRMPIFIYFKNSQVNIDDVDLEGLKKIRRFKDSIKDKGLYITFVDLKDFEKLVRLNLSQWLAEKQSAEPKPDLLPSEKSNAQTSVFNDGYGNSISEPDDDDGFIDLLIKGEDSTYLIAELSEKITDLTGKLGKHMDKSTEEINNFQETGQTQNIKLIKRVINKFASYMNDYADQMEPLVSHFSKQFMVFSDAYSRAASIAGEYVDIDDSEIFSAYEGASALLSQLRESQSAMSKFKDVVADLPKITGEMNRAKRRAVRVLERFYNEFDSAITLTNEVLNSFAAMMGDDNEKDITS